MSTRLRKQIIDLQSELAQVKAENAALKEAIKDALKNWWPAEEGDYRYDKAEHDAKKRLYRAYKSGV